MPCVVSGSGNTRVGNKGYDLGAGAAVVRDGRVLLVQEAAGPHAGTWSFPKGVIEPGETAVDAALRELREETGLQGRVTGVVGLRTRARPDFSSLFVVFRVEAKGDPVPDHQEIGRARFFSAEEVAALEPIFELTRLLALRALNGHIPMTELHAPTMSGPDYRVFA
ncbi:MAG: NUDIX domain-containing protein [Anaerolineae bacterium]|nr:NUDIX domain-containing protein [Anaerolineae bacterium]